VEPDVAGDRTAGDIRGRGGPLNPFVLVTSYDQRGGRSNFRLPCGRQRLVSRGVQHLSVKSKWAWFWPVAWAATVFFESSQSKVPTPDFPHSDKYLHFLAYGLLASLVCRLGRGWHAALVAVLAASAYGATDEWHQLYTPGRSCELADWVADTAGAALAVGVYAGWPWYRRLMETPLGRKRRIEKLPVAATLPPA